MQMALQAPGTGKSLPALMQLCIDVIPCRPPLSTHLPLSCLHGQNPPPACTTGITAGEPLGLIGPGRRKSMHHSCAAAAACMLHTCLPFTRRSVHHPVSSMCSQPGCIGSALRDAVDRSSSQAVSKLKCEPSVRGQPMGRFVPSQPAPAPRSLPDSRWQAYCRSAAPVKTVGDGVIGYLLSEEPVHLLLVFCLPLCLSDLPLLPRLLHKPVLPCKCSFPPYCSCALPLFCLFQPLPPQLCK
jgi:hypothetical protein